MTIRSRLAWRTKAIRHANSDSLSFWLQDRGSLTARLQAKVLFPSNCFNKSLAKPTLDEAVALGIAHQATSLDTRSRPALRWRTARFSPTRYFPYRPRGPLSRWLSRLGNQSLGALLLHTPVFRRGALSCKRLDHRHALFLPAAQAMDLSLLPLKNYGPDARPLRLAPRQYWLLRCFSPSAKNNRELARREPHEPLQCAPRALHAPSFFCNTLRASRTWPHL